jgi:hypothetical protein
MMSQLNTNLKYFIKDIDLRLKTSFFLSEDSSQIETKKPLPDNNPHSRLRCTETPPIGGGKGPQTRTFFIINRAKKA